MLTHCLHVFSVVIHTSGENFGGVDKKNIVYNDLNMSSVVLQYISI